MEETSIISYLFFNLLYFHYFPLHFYHFFFPSFSCQTSITLDTKSKCNQDAKKHKPKHQHWPQQQSKPYKLLRTKLANTDDGSKSNVNEWNDTVLNPKILNSFLPCLFLSFFSTIKQVEHISKSGFYHYQLFSTTTERENSFLSGPFLVIFSPTKHALHSRSDELKQIL